MQKREALALGFQRAEGKRWGPHVSSGARRLAQTTAGQFQRSLQGREGLSKQEVHHPDVDVSLISAKPSWASFPKTFHHSSLYMKTNSASSLPNHHVLEEKTKRSGKKKERQGTKDRNTRKKSELERETGRQVAGEIQGQGKEELEWIYSFSSVNYTHTELAKLRDTLERQPEYLRPPLLSAPYLQRIQ